MWSVRGHPYAHAVARVARNLYVRAAATHVGMQVVAVLVLWAMASVNGLDLVGRLAAWDGQWYLGIAEHSYAGYGAMHGDFATQPLAYFPMLPVLMSLLGMFGLPLVAAGVVVSATAGVVASCGIVRLAGHVDSRQRVGLLLVALHAAAPLSITMSMVYTEALFAAFAVWALVGVLERQWVIAGSCCILAGLSRSTAIVLIVVVVVAALIAWWRERDRVALLAVVAAPVGLLVFWGNVAAITGSVTGWQDIEERGWGIGFDFGVKTAVWFAETIASGSSVMYVVIAALLVAAPVLAVWCARVGVPWPLVAYAAGVIVLVVGTGGLEMTKARLLLPAAFVLLLPVAMRLADYGRAGMLARLAVIAPPCVWFSAYALTGWDYAI